MNMKTHVTLIALCVAAFPLASLANTFVFNPRTASYKAYNDRGRLVRWGRASGGGNYCADIGRSCRTPVGTFRIQSMGGRGCRSSKYPLGSGGAPMPYCMFFKKKLCHPWFSPCPQAQCESWLYSCSKLGCPVVVSPVYAYWYKSGGEDGIKG